MTIYGAKVTAMVVVERVVVVVARFMRITDGCVH